VTSSAPAVARDIGALRARFADDEGLRPIGLGGVLLGAGVLGDLPAVVADVRRADGDVVVLADRRPMTVKSQVLGLLDVRRVDVGGEDFHPHADAATIDAAVAAIDGAGVVVSVGSGTVTDIGKAVCARLDVAHVVVQTAASVNGFADGESVLLVDGVKRTTTTRWPDRLVVDTGVLAGAPLALNQAGLGDLLATYTAPADWLLARFVAQDGSYAQVVVDLAREHVDAAVAVAPGIRAADPEALEDLAAALTLSGLSMGVAGRTAPGSGMEHTVSHLLEMADPASTALHGAKVGILSVLAALLWERVREAAPGATLRLPDAASMERRVREAFATVDPGGAMGEECWSDYARKLARWGAMPDVPAGWAAFDAEVGPLLAPAERLAGALAAAGAPLRLSELGIDAGTARWALLHCHLMRDRFTVADLAFLLGIWEADDVEALLDDAARIGVGL
jgi:glycerol-1-phosphate dehydrogenase [NAD(P)+]